MQHSFFTTTDWYLCVWLIAKDFEMVSIDKRDIRKCVFQFEDSQKIREAVKAFWDNETVEIQSFITAIKRAKILLHSDSFTKFNFN